MAKGMYAVSRRDLERARDQIRRTQTRHARDAARTAELKNVAIRAASVVAGAGGSAALQARYGITGIGPVPIDLAGGALLIAASAFTKAGMTSDILEGLGDGMLASFATKFGAGLGTQWRQSSGAATTPAPVQTAGIGNWGTPPAFAYGQVPAMPYVDPYAAAYAAQANNWNGSEAQVADAFRRGAMG